MLGETVSVHDSREGLLVRDGKQKEEAAGIALT
jgi:hypothetical protein